MKIYTVESTAVIPETQALFERVWREGVELGKWTEDQSLKLEMSYVESVRLNTLIEALTNGEEWNIRMYPHDLSQYLNRPILYYAPLELLDAADPEFPTQYPHVMSARMRDVILQSGVRGTSYPVAVFETSLLEQVSEEYVLSTFDREGHIRFHMLHLFELLPLFDEATSTRRHFVATHLPEDLPPFFVVSTGPCGSLLATEEGKALLEQGQFRGVAFQELPITWPEP
jgi:hypothetical protein